jgi:hypothetical protein
MIGMTLWNYTNLTDSAPSLTSVETSCPKMAGCRISRLQAPGKVIGYPSAHASGQMTPRVYAWSRHKEHRPRTTMAWPREPSTDRRAVGSQPRIEPP